MIAESGESSPSAAGLPGNAVEILRALSLSRAAEERLADLEDEGVVRHAPRRSAFREAGPVGAAFAIRLADDGSGDILAPTFRAAGALTRFGVTLDDFFQAHVDGEVGPARGAGAELHRVDLQHGLLAPVVPLGLLVEVMGGVALGAFMKGEARVGVVCDSDGATSTGAWHEGLVFAAARRVPMVLVVEAGSSRARARGHTRVESFTEKAAGYGIGATSVEGGDVLAVIDAVRSSVERARSGAGVQMVEIRYSDIDPLEELRDRILYAGLASADELAAIETESRDACAEAAARVGAGANTEMPESLNGVYTDSARIVRRVWVGPRVPAAV